MGARGGGQEVGSRQKPGLTEGARNLDKECDRATDSLQILK